MATIGCHLFIVLHRSSMPGVAAARRSNDSQSPALTARVEGTNSHCGALEVNIRKGLLLSDYWRSPCYGSQGLTMASNRL